MEAEQALLGAILLDNQALDRVSGFLTSQHFYDPLHGRIFETMAALIQAGKTATPVTVKTFFENVKPVDATTTVPQYLGRLVKNATTISYALQYARTVFDLATMRQLALIGEDLAANAYGVVVDTSPFEILAQHEAQLDKLKSISGLSSREALFEFAEDAAIENEIEDVIKGVISTGAVGFLYGESGLGKTFLALQAVSAIGRGAPFFDRRTREAAALYVALEGRGRFGRRLRAAVSSYNLPRKRVARLLTGVTFGRSAEAQTGVSTIIAAVKAIATASGLGVGLVVIDTLARALAGDNENEAAAISALITQAQRIAETTGAAVLIVHHPGKDTERGMRGSYSLYADADFVLRVKGNKGPGAKSLVLEKSKDDEEGALGDFTLEKILLGQDQSGEEITSMIVRPVGEPLLPQKPTRPRSRTAAEKALCEIEQLVSVGRYIKADPVQHPRALPGAELVSEDDWRAACAGKRLSDGSEQSEQRAFRRARETLLGSGQNDSVRPALIGTQSGWVWLLIGHDKQRAAGQNSAQ